MSHAIGGTGEPDRGRHHRRDDETAGDGSYQEPDYIDNDFDDRGNYVEGEPAYNDGLDDEPWYAQERAPRTQRIEREPEFDNEPDFGDDDFYAGGEPAAREERVVEREPAIERYPEPVVEEVPVEKKRSIWPYIATGIAGLVIGGLAVYGLADRFAGDDTEETAIEQTEDVSQEPETSAMDPTPLTGEAISGSLAVALNYADEPGTVDARNEDGTIARIVPSGEGTKLYRVNADVTNNGEQDFDARCGQGLNVSLIGVDETTTSTPMEKGWSAVENSADCEAPVAPGATETISWIFEVPANFVGSEFVFTDPAPGSEEARLSISDVLSAPAPAPAEPVAPAPNAEPEIDPDAAPAPAPADAPVPAAPDAGVPEAPAPAPAPEGVPAQEAPELP